MDNFVILLTIQCIKVIASFFFPIKLGFYNAWFNPWNTSNNSTYDPNFNNLGFICRYYKFLGFNWYN